MKKEVERRIVRRTIRELWDRVDDGDGVLTKDEVRGSLSWFRRRWQGSRG